MAKKKRTSRTRLSRGVFVSMCLVAAFVLAVGTGIFSQRTLEEQALSGNTATNLSESVAEVNVVEEEQPEPFEVISDTEYGDYEKGKILIIVDETTDMQHLDAVLAASDLVETKTVSGQDLSNGFVQIDIDGDAPIKQALGVFEEEGFDAQPNYVYYPAEDEIVSSAVSINDPSASQQWALESLDAYRAWEIAKGKEDTAFSPKVSVAVIDTGCLVTHEDLINNIRAVYNSATSEIGVDKVSDSIGHGTHVAGIVAADANNGKGVAGVSYDAGLVIIKASQGETKNFTTETLAQAYTWLMTNSGTQTPAQAHNVRVVNMSVGGKGSIDRDDVLYKKITQAKSAGILTVCAAGNADSGAVPPYNCIPGDYEDCLTVINLARGSNAQPNDSSGTAYVVRSNSSNYNVASGELSQAKNVSAPGAGIYSTTYSGTSSYGSMSGTSMASPAVAGVAALLFAYDPNLGVDEARDLLEQTATDIGTAGWDRETGYGEIDAYHALQVLSADIANDQIMGEQPVDLEVQGADGIAADASEWQWESSDPSILAVDNTAGTATAIGSGVATLSATHKKLASRTLSKQVDVNAAGLEEKIDLSDSSAISASIDPGQSFAYTGQEARPSVTVKTKDGKVLKEGTDYTLEYANNISASVNTTTKKARVVIAASSTSGIYTGSIELNFMIDQADISSATVDSIADQKYTGAAVTPMPVVKLNGKALSAIDYAVSYKNNTNAGTATLTVTGKGNYKGTKETTFKITQEQGGASTSSSTEGQSSVITVPATYTYSPTIHPQTLTASVTYDSNFVKGQKARFTYNVSGNMRPLLYKLNSFEIETASGWSPLVDITRGEYGTFTEKNYFEDALYTPGNYRLSFIVAEYTANANGTKTPGDMQRFQINFTVAESDNFKSIETVVAEVVSQCEQECVSSKGTASYDYDRALWLNDWLVANTKYDSTLTYCSAEGVFNRGLGTCEGYHEAYTMLLNKAGIETRRVDDFGDAHVWTGVKLNGNWYNVDTTWNDTGDYVRGDLDLQRLYFALPSSIIQKTHPKWDGQYSVRYPDRATFDANAYADNYFIHSGEIAQYTNSYLAESGAYSVKGMLNSSSVKSQLATNGSTSFDLKVEKSSWPEGYKNVIYSLVAYQLGTQDWGSGIKVSVGYSDDALHFSVTADGSIPRISITNAVVVNLNDQTYSGQALTPKPTVMVGGKTLVESTDYQLSYSNNVNANVAYGAEEATIIIQGKGAYCGSLKKTFTINQASMSSAAIAAISAQTYTGSALTPKPTVTLGGKALTTNDYTVSYKNNTNAGTATLTITGKGNCTGTKEVTFKINAKQLPSAPVLSTTSYTYDGKAKTPGVTVKDGSKTLVNDTDYTVTYSNNVNVGTAATVTVTGKGNYTGTQRATFKINAASSSGGGSTTKPATTPLSRATVVKFNTTRNITGKTINLPVNIKYASKNLTSSDYTLTYNNSSSFPTKAGTYTVRAVGKGSYSGTIDVGTLVLAQGPSVGSNVQVKIAPIANLNYVLDAVANPPKIGANISIWNDNGGDNQKWYLVLGDDGYYTIKSAANQSFIIDAAANPPKVGSNVSIWTTKNQNNQKWIIEPSTNGSYIIRNAANPSLVLDAAGVSPKCGANVSVWSAKSQNNNNQKWTIKTLNDVYTSLDSLAAQNKNAITDGTYVIYASAVGGNPVLDVVNGATNEGANIQLGASNASTNQIWEITHSGNYVLIKNKKSGKYLSVASDNSLSGANVVQSANANARGAKWVFLKNSDGSFSIRSALYTGISLDVQAGKSASGTNIETWMSNSTKAQKFKLVSVPAQVAECDNTIDTTGYYCIKSMRNNNLQLDINAASTANNTNVQIWSATKMPWQLFRFEYVNGYYRIISAHSNKVLTVQNNSLVPGANVVMYTAGTADNQLWRAQKNADGSYTFFNKKNGYALYVGSSSPKAGTNVCTSGYSPTSSEQKFKLERVTNLMPTGLYNLKSALNASQVLDVTAGSGSNNANIETWINNGGIAQKWNIQVVAGKENIYTLQAVCSGKYLADNGLGNAVQVASGVDSKSQWKASIVGGSYVLTNVETGKALDVTNSKVASGTNVGTKIITNGVNQRWNLVTTAPLPNGTYIIRSRVNTSQVLEIAGSSTGNNGNAAMWKYHGGGNQKFNFTRNSDGTYTVVNCNSGKALDAAKGASSAGTNIAQFNKKNQKNQHWCLVYNSDGSFKLVSAANSQVVIGFNGSSPSNGANVCLVKDTNASSQHFKLEKTTYVPPMPAPQRDMLNKAQGYSSGTGYLIMVNRATHKVGVFKGSQGNWSYQHYWSCVTGAPGSPTITGVYRTTGYKRMSLTTDSRARWCTQISGGYFFHTILASESELGNSLSHGCVRLAIPSAQWIYNNVGRGTTVVLYN